MTASIIYKKIEPDHFWIIQILEKYLEADQ